MAITVGSLRNPWTKKRMGSAYGNRIPNMIPIATVACPWKCDHHKPQELCYQDFFRTRLFVFTVCFPSQITPSHDWVLSEFYHLDWSNIQMAYASSPIEFIKIARPRFSYPQLPKRLLYFSKASIEQQKMVYLAAWWFMNPRLFLDAPSSIIKSLMDY